MINIEIGNKKYKVKQAITEEEKAKGLQNVESLPRDEGVLFCFTPPEDVSFWMKDTKIPLDIIFIDDNENVISVKEGIPESTKPIVEKDVAYVLELNKNSDIHIGDSLEFPDDNGPVMKVLNPDGSDQYELWGGERIFSRKNSRVLIRKAKKADESKDDKDYKSLGKYIFKCLKIQNNREPEYVENPQKKED